MVDKIGYSKPATPAARAAQVKKASAVQGSSFASVLAGVDAPQDVDAATPLAAMSAVGTLIGAQEVTEEELRRRQTLKRGRLTLDALEALRDGLLTGRMPRESLKQLETMVQQERMLTADPRLNEVLDDIELRAAVELAKLEMSGIRL